MRHNSKDDKNGWVKHMLIVRNVFGTVYRYAFSISCMQRYEVENCSE